MEPLPFRHDVVTWLADHRHPLLTPVMQFFTGLGEIDGYILVVALVYVAYDKRLGVRLAVLTLVAMSVNHILKTLIQNPRPFIGDGSYSGRWAVTPERGADLATEFSTPSGHAMAAGAFYGYLLLVARQPAVRLAALVCIVLIGASRPYLGVHYVEDVLSGWLIGFGLAWLAWRYAVRAEAAWDRLSVSRQAVVLVAGSVVLWLATDLISPAAPNGPPTAFVSYAGLLTGVLLGQRLEQQWVRFDPRRGGVWRALLRYGLCVACVLATLVGLELAFAALAADTTPFGFGLRYVRYSAAGLMGIVVAPLLCLRLGLAHAAR